MRSYGKTLAKCFSVTFEKFLTPARCNRATRGFLLQRQELTQSLGKVFTVNQRKRSNVT